MSWVLLGLRESELKRTHSYYVSEDLKISRDMRKMHRHYHLEQTVVQNKQKSALSDLRNAYNSKRSSYHNAISNLREDAKNNGTDYSREIQEAYDALDAIKLEYEENVNQEKSVWEDDLALIEEESNEYETQKEEEKDEIETQMESISQEIKVVSQAKSEHIQNEVIKLS